MARFANLWRGAGIEPAKLSARVRVAIAAEQDRAEIVIGCVQLAIVAVFGLFYMVSPKTFSADVPFAPVPYALTIYAAFTLVRLAAAFRMRLPGWFLAMSIVVDMALLMTLIWSFHIQYMQPPAFYLKAPTLLYVFIFIALRSLRFEARYVLLAGAAGALGWLALVAWAAAYDMGSMPVTRDYVRYMTSPSILWGAEIDKVMSIVIVTLILALAQARARAMLERAAAQGSAILELSRFFAPEIAKRIAGAEQALVPGEGEMRAAAALFVDLRGFSDLSRELLPKDVVALLSDYQARLVPVIRAHGGSVDKFIGDGIFASFGAALPSTRYAADALACVDALLFEAQSWRADRMARKLAAPQVGFGVAAGTVLFACVGDADRLEYTIIGDSVNLAARLEKQTKRQSCSALTTRAAFELALAQGYMPSATPRPIAAVQIEGIGAPVDLVMLG
jgi:adenylate cyclase